MYKHGHMHFPGLPRITSFSPSVLLTLGHRHNIYTIITMDILYSLDTHLSYSLHTYQLQVDFTGRDLEFRDKRNEEENLMGVRVSKYSLPVPFMSLCFPAHLLDWFDSLSEVHYSFEYCTGSISLLPTPETFLLLALCDGENRKGHSQNYYSNFAHCLIAVSFREQQLL